MAGRRLTVLPGSSNTKFAAQELQALDGRGSGSSGFVVEDFGFGVLYRLKKTDEFSSVFAFRRSLRGGAFQLFYRPNGLKSARLGVVVGKRFVRQAVKRNRVKRLVREAFRVARAGLPPLDLVLRVMSKPDDFEGNGLRHQIEALLRRVGSGVASV